MTTPDPVELPRSDMAPTSGHSRGRAPVAESPETDEASGEPDSGSLVENQSNTKSAEESVVR